MVGRLQHEGGRALAIHHPVTIAFERAACGGRIVRAVREQFVASEHHRPGMETASGASHEHHVGPTPTDHAGRLADRQKRRCLTADERVVGATGVVKDRHVRGDHVGELFE
jgi:hypothetical protein